ncbi:DUF438 domain-containing protein [Acidaminobacter sp.]|uniref:DUF438 domain-containing protein n=1 Tax=Acidaminobacter sp. TaxID=1872102 RepID=UPI00255E68C8|nr:PAS domain-containing protein [Acidaminobacter sp.]MDK9711823.1 PAS domain-containing protein [Acidaminobacter sp.]
MKINETRVSRLVDYVRGVLKKQDGKSLYLEFRSDLEAVTPQEVFEIMNHVWSSGTGYDDILSVLDKIINVFYHALSSYTWPKPEPNSFIDLMLRENQAMNAKMDQVKAVLKQGKTLENREKLLETLTPLLEFEAHYLKKENILFPVMEQRMPRFEGVGIMWALHDNTRANLKHVIQMLTEGTASEQEINAELGQLFFNMIGLDQKESLILYPCASEVLDPETFKAMTQQSFEYGFPFLDPQTLPEPVSADGLSAPHPTPNFQGLEINTGTGTLSADQLVMMLNALPVDMTYLDENDKVRYFSRPKDRFFPRSAAIIGRDVRYCHPPQSVDKVLDIVQAFKEGRQDTASFWIDLRGRKVLIQYFALRTPGASADGPPTYRGVLEVSQDITDIQKMEGQRRLLSWEE